MLLILADVFDSSLISTNHRYTFVADIHDSSPTNYMLGGFTVDFFGIRQLVAAVSRSPKGDYDGQLHLFEKNQTTGLGI